MNLNSIFAKITIIFSVMLILVFSAFGFYIISSSNGMDEKVVKSHDNLSRHLMVLRMPKHMVVEYLKEQNYRPVRDPREVLDDGEMLHSKRPFDTFKYKNTYYFHMKTPFFRLLVKDNNEFSRDYSGYFLFVFIIVFLGILYFWLINSLKPLKSLKEEISKFASGELNINCKSDKKDEIAEVSNEFDKAAKEIDLLLKSRQLFLRTVMHELKTPIAKGRIVSELLEDEKQRNRMATIFERLDFMINDFAKIEEVVTNNYEVHKNRYKIEEILDNSFLMLMQEKEKFEVEGDILKCIRVDFELFSMVVKNLLDNGIKYSSDKKVKIVISEEKISFYSHGSKLDKPIQEYFKPFHNDTKSKNHGMGLGLYIVKSILDMHKMDFSYRYDGEFNIFEIALVD